jgi:hypothetical protein
MNDDQLSRLLKDAVSDIEPADRIEELRASVRPRGRIVHLLHARPWYAAAGIVAAVICLVATITTVASNNSADPGFAGPPGSTRPTVIATDTAVRTESPTGETRTYAVYYIGTSPQDKPVLYREFHRGSAAASPTRLAIDGLESRPLDPDYVTPWRPRDIVEVKPDLARDVVYVSLGHDRLEDRPASMSPAYARAAVQQVVYTVQAAVGKRLPVQFLIAGVPAATVLGIPATEPIPQRNVLQTLSLMSISDPNEGETVSGKLRVRGVNNGFEGNVVVHLERGGTSYLQKATIGGWGEGRLFPWQVTLDVSGLEPGTYTLVASNDDPSGGQEGFGPATDTRTIVVK